ncbi:uncharacterized protein ASCRUDRAFT_8801 [Ascoidea rubescens DSM 1968]|uniref:Uncharacterized protein n=1 Tax=Ascoidea rubescens DSM 1968 TaxID=1344418 RepID=A0A1D2VEX1_9ASCO|nr:hypothetical protein ASCRUDRAFT_8801 [Ascoidea rubescens DSM 1968]ODV60017.1 hypothetical protein ASCRUDRAFT_8801 [Ascoidea rubescens DSM 1968]
MALYKNSMQDIFYKSIYILHQAEHSSSSDKEFSHYIKVKKGAELNLLKKMKLFKNHLQSAKCNDNVVIYGGANIFDEADSNDEDVRDANHHFNIKKIQSFTNSKGNLSDHYV